MSKKLMGVLICILLIFTSVLPAIGTVNISKNTAKEWQIVVEERSTTKRNDVDWWPMFHHDLQSTGYSTSSAPSTNKVLWTVGNWGNYWDDPQRCSPVIVNDTIYIGACDMDFPLKRNTYAMNPLTIDNYMEDEISPLLWYETIVYSFDAHSGNELWRTYLPNQYFIGGAPAVANGRVYITSNNDTFSPWGHGYLFCLDALTGDILWNFSICQRYISPVVNNGRVFLPGWEFNEDYSEVYAKLYCLDAVTGTEIYNSTLGNGKTIMAPALYNNRLYISCYDESTEYVYLSCIDVQNGDILWCRDLEGTTKGCSPVIYNDKVIISSTFWYGGNEASGKLWCLDTETGNEIWSYFTENLSNAISTPAVAYGNIYVPLSEATIAPGSNGNGEMHCLNASTGEIVWKKYLGLDLWNSPAVADGKIYVNSQDWGGSGGYTIDGYVHCLDAFTGDVIWNYWLESGPQISPVIANGSLYIATPGFLYAFDDSAPSNNPPVVEITGPTKVKPGEDYTYTIVANDPEGEDVYMWVLFSFEEDNQKYDGYGSWYNSGEEEKLTLDWSWQDGPYKVLAIAQDTHFAWSAWAELNVTDINVTSAFLLGFIENVEDEGDFSFITAKRLLSARLIPFEIRVLSSGEEIVISNDYLGFVGKRFMIGRFKADLD